MSLMPFAIFIVGIMAADFGIAVLCLYICLGIRRRGNTMNFYTVTFWTSLEYPVEVEVTARNENDAFGEALEMYPEHQYIEATISLNLEKDCS